MRFRRHDSGDHRGRVQRKTPQAWLDPRSQVPGGTPSAELSLGWMLASRANLRFTRRVDDTKKRAMKTRAPKAGGREARQSVAKEGLFFVQTMGSTSEELETRLAPAQIWNVTNTNDAGAGSLRAILRGQQLQGNPAVAIATGDTVQF